MHTVQYSYYHFHHEGDYSGEVIISGPAARFRQEPGLETEMRIPFEALKRFVADWVSWRKRSRLEIATADAILLGGWEVPPERR